MHTFNESIEKNHRTIIFSLTFVVAFFAASCTFHDIIPICHSGLKISDIENKITLEGWGSIGLETACFSLVFLWL